MVVRSPYPDITLPGQSHPAFMMEQMRAHGDRPAYVDAASGRALTYGQLVSRVERVAAGLARRGFRRGEVAMLHSPNSLDWPVAYYALLSLGGVVTTANPLVTASELATQLQDSGASWLFSALPVLDVARAAARQAGVEQLVVLGPDDDAPADAIAFDRLADGGAPPAVEIEPTDLALLLYSSGTTGLPKGAMLTHRNLTANTLQAGVAVPFTPDDRVIAVIPFSHSVGVCLYMHRLPCAGASTILLPRFDLESFLRAIQDHRATHVFAVPPIVVALAKHPLVDRFDLSSLKMIGTGAAPIKEEVVRACAARLGCRIQQAWGLTEATAVVSFPPPDDDTVASVGMLVSNIELRVVDPVTGAELGANQAGELWVRGPNVMRGYHNQPDATAETITVDGWLKTGDIGYIDGAGYVYIVDRIKEMIKYKGYQVSPAEIEGVLLSHPAIADAAVIGCPDDEAGEVPKAFVVRAGEIDEAAVMALVAERLAPYKKVRAVEFVDAIPTSPTGKILRRVLVERERMLV